MIICCNESINTSFSYLVENNNNRYRRIEYGVCPVCGRNILKDYKLTDTIQTVKHYTGKRALAKYAYWEHKLRSKKRGNKNNMFWLYQYNGIIKDFNDVKKGFYSSELISVT